MANDSGQSNKKAVDLIQTVVVLAAIPLGVIPLVQYLTSDDHGGLFTTLFGEQTGSLAVLLPALIIVGALVIVGALEAVKRRGKKDS
ncbi:hypothetical protein [Saccharomonospora glauca]|jgi:hypothetical protein|uniref:Uncharacterized protein n=1 Tax=Saccharomonospora glauca K62 TaxID=928724 RepID=I1D214_9PSEU|nr:hypothetical protein [Saccharomonospora glauca]EIE98988.1 hypothetical protein SacglDRAFT_02083 [Saccharomonospora glauca K62]